MKTCVVKFARVIGTTGDRLDGKPGTRADVTGPGYLVGPGLAVAVAPDDEERGWQINHLPTGYAIVRDFATRTKAVAAAQILLEAPVHWERLSAKPSREVTRKAQPYLRRALELSRTMQTSLESGGFVLGPGLHSGPEETGKEQT